MSTDSSEATNMPKQSIVIKSDFKDEIDKDTLNNNINNYNYISNNIIEPYDMEISKSIIHKKNLDDLTHNYKNKDTLNSSLQPIKEQLENVSIINSISSNKENSNTDTQKEKESELSSEYYENSIKLDNNFIDEKSILSSEKNDFNQSKIIEKELLSELNDIKKINDLNQIDAQLEISTKFDQWDDNTLDDEMIIHKQDEENQDEKINTNLNEIILDENLKKLDLSSNTNLINKNKNNLGYSAISLFSSADNSSSLNEFERLEKEVDLLNSNQAFKLNSNKISHHSSLDSIGSISSLSGNLIGTPKTGNFNSNSFTAGGDNISINSLTEFERLEYELKQNEEIENNLQLNESKTLSQIEEGHESQASESAETISACSHRLKKEEDDSDIEYELNAKLTDYFDEDKTPVTSRKLAENSKENIDSLNEEYDEEILKIVTTTEKKIIEEVNDKDEINSKVSQITKVTTKQRRESEDDGTTFETIYKTATSTKTILN